MKAYMVLLAQLGFQPPVYAFLSLCGIRDYKVGRPEGDLFLDPNQ
jgi:hypothetical protein